MPENKGEHLTLEDRQVIEDAIRDGLGCRATAARLHVAPSTVSREVEQTPTGRHGSRARGAAASRRATAGSRPSSRFARFVQYEAPEYLESCAGIAGIPMKKHASREIDFLSPEGVGAVISAASGDLRELAVLSVLYESAARASEVAALNVCDATGGSRSRSGCSARGARSASSPSRRRWAGYSPIMSAPARARRNRRTPCS